MRVNAMSFFSKFPAMAKSDLRDFKKGIDGAYKDFSREYGEAIETFFDPLYYFLTWFEKLLNATPWPIIILIVGGLAYLGSRSWKLAVGAMISFLLIGYLGMWKNTMSTVALISVATLLCIVIGIPLGIWMSRSDRVQKLITPILDIMQL
jgi:glycine betaine/proline transport system permease protein